MGCSISKLDDEAVQLCKDRKRLIKEAIEHRARFAAAHDAYVQSLRRVSAVLHDYIEWDEHQCTPVKNLHPVFASVSDKSFKSLPIKSRPGSVLNVSYLKSRGTAAVTMEEEPPEPPTTARMGSYSTVHSFGVGGFFQMPPSSTDPSFLPPRTAEPSPPPPPQMSEWDYFWNPFSFLDNYCYLNPSTSIQAAMDDESGLQKIREEEGIPDLEEEGATADERDTSETISSCEECSGIKEDVLVEEENEEEFDRDTNSSPSEIEHEVGEMKSCCTESVQVLGRRSAGRVELENRGKTVCNMKAGEGSPELVFSVGRKAASIKEIFRLLEIQFNTACNSGNVVSAMLESARAQYSLKSNELMAMKMLNPVALIRSASSHSSSSRYLFDSASSADESHESSSEFSSDSRVLSDSHQSTLERLYIWEKKLYDEVRSVSRSQISYARKCKQLHESDMKGKDPSASEKVSSTMHDLYARISVLIHSITSISTRIEALRDKELNPQLLELAQGLATMWSVMAECHRSQKQALSKKPERTRRHGTMEDDPQHLAALIDRIEIEANNWRSCLKSWITSQRSYIHALTGWLARSNSEVSLPMLGICIQWSKFLDDITMLDGLDFLASTVGSLREEGDLEEMKEVATRVLCSGLSAAMASMLDFALSRAQGYASLASQWEHS